MVLVQHHLPAVTLRAPPLSAAREAGGGGPGGARARARARARAATCTPGGRRETFFPLSRSLRRFISTLACGAARQCIEHTYFSKRYTQICTRPPFLNYFSRRRGRSQGSDTRGRIRNDLECVVAAGPGLGLHKVDAFVR